MKVKKALRIKKTQLNKISKSLKSHKRVPQEKLAEYLRWRTPKSESWFMRKWKASNMLHVHDLFNRPLGPFIPDCFNGMWKYVIEIDGTIHGLENKIQSDIKKDLYFKQKGFVVFRVKAYDEASFQMALKQVQSHISDILEKRRSIFGASEIVR